MNLDDAKRFAREQLDAIPPTKYEVSPQQAYETAGIPYGKLRTVTLEDSCRGCGGLLAVYSQSGAREVAISRMCEPCFDFTMIFPDDRDETEQRWMSLVKYSEET